MLQKLKNLSKHLTSTNIAILIFVIYFIVGMLIFRDYGISTDEPIERQTSLSNYTFIMERLMASSENDAVREVLYHTTNLMDWHDRYYGVALQTLTVIIEHARGFTMSYREIFLIRHAFTFINYFIASIFFFLILRRRFGDGFFPVVGVLFFILYPRFFGESFFNIKDVLFFAWCVIASYFTLRWLEDENKSAFIAPAAITLAIATNTRILGLSILLLACGFAIMQGLRRKGTLGHNVKKSFHLLAFTFVAYVIITPFTWENPIKNTIDTFFHFMRFQPWNWTHFYMGEMIYREVPWHYIPVWMSITVPILYILTFLIGFIVIGIGATRTLYSVLPIARVLRRFSASNPPAGDNTDHDKQILFDSPASGGCGLSMVDEPIENDENVSEMPTKTKTNPIHLYDLFFMAMFTFTLLGFIGLGISMYEGWRHAYYIFLPFLYIAIYGLYRAYKFYHRDGKITKYSFIGAVYAYMMYLLIWMVINHPYQYVYFNLVGRQFAEENFTLDYWYVANIDLARYALDSSDEPVITFSGGHRFLLLLTEEERERVAFAAEYNADFYIRGSRLEYEWRMEPPPEGFHEAKVIRVDGMRIATLFRRELTINPQIDEAAFEQVVGFESNVNHNFQYLSDGDFHTRWSTARPQRRGDSLTLEFGVPVNYSYMHLNQGRETNDYPRDLLIYTSGDGVNWYRAYVETVEAATHFVFRAVGDYRFLRLIVDQHSDYYWWSVADLSFGHVRPWLNKP